MSGATFSRVHNFTSETLTAAAINAEFNNILNNLDPTGVGQYSNTVAQMRITTDPGTAGSESLATSLAGELERLRFVIQRIIGAQAAQWYSAPTASMTDLLNALGGNLVTNRVISGAISTNSSAPRYLTPTGTTPSITIAGATTPLVYAIAGVQYTISTNFVLTGLGTAAATNVTTSVNDATLNAQEYTKWIGEDGSVLQLAGGASAIPSNTFSAFQLVHGGTKEYFIGYATSTTAVQNCMRGYFLDSAGSPVIRGPVSNADAVRLLQLSWLFATTAAQVVASSTNPSVSYASPSNTSGYWYDITNAVWKSFANGSWSAAGATLIGMSVQDQTACQAARGINFYGAVSPYSNAVLDWNSGNQIMARNMGTKVSVGTSLIDFKMTKPVWDITANIESGYTATASTTYFAYVSEHGQTLLSPNKPYLSNDLGQGWYHPYENWRSLGYCKLTAGTAFDVYTLQNYRVDQNSIEQFIDLSDMINIGLSQTTGTTHVYTINGADGKELSPGNPGYVTFRNDNATSAVIARHMLMSNISITQPVGASLGIQANMDQYIWLYMIDTATTVDIGLCAQTPLNENSVGPSYSQISSGATSKGALYSNGSGGSGRGIRLAARIKLNENNPGTPAGGNTISEISMRPTLFVNVEDWNQSRNIQPNTIAFSGLQSVNTYTRRVFDSLEVRMNFGWMTSGGVAMNFTLPSGVAIDASKLSGPQGVGWWSMLNGQSAINYAQTASGIVSTSGAQTSQFYLSLAGAQGQAPVATASQLPGASQSIVLYATLPILGWSTYGP